MYNNLETSNQQRPSVPFIIRKQMAFNILIGLMVSVNFLFLLSIVINLNKINDLVDNKVNYFNDSFSTISENFHTIYNQYNTNDTYLYIAKSKIIIDNICQSIDECKNISLS